MKKYQLSILAFFLISILMWSCEKDENRVLFEEGTAPALSASIPGPRQDSISLSKPNKDLPAVTFSWTNPTYRVNTGVSSQNVNYALQLRKLGGPWVTVNTTISTMTKSYTQGEFNGFLINPVAEGGLNLAPDSNVVIETRVTSYLGALSKDNVTNLSSNVMSFKARTFSVIPDLWITGEACASNWTNTPPANQKFIYNTVTKNHTLTVQLGGGVFYKFLTQSGSWQPQWGINAGTVTDVLGQTFSIKVNDPGDPEAMKSPATAGMYKLTVNLENKTAKVEL